MASELTLEIEGHKKDILRYECLFHRDIIGNRPVQSLWGGEIFVYMQSDSDTTFLEMLMGENEITNKYGHKVIVPSPVSGKILFTKDDKMFRELTFQNAYVVFYSEKMKYVGDEPMTTCITISPMCMEVNRQIKMRKLQPSGVCLGWTQVIDDLPKPLPNQPYSPPTLLVESVDGASEALIDESVNYKVTSYNLPDVKDSDREQVRWDIEIDGKKESLKLKGESITLKIKKDWYGKTIKMMPYLKKSTEKVSKTTNIHCSHSDGAIKVAEYIVMEIKKNTKSNIASSIRYYASDEEFHKRVEEWKNKSTIAQLFTTPEPPNLLKAKALWTERVFKGRPWDHKPIIKRLFSSFAVKRTEYSSVSHKNVVYESYYHKYKNYDYFYDVWSNIHYGYVGLSVGFNEKTLLDGANLAQIIDSRGANSEDTGDDKIAIMIGFKLYKRYGRYANGLTAKAVLEALDKAIMTESKKKHICICAK